MPTDRLTQVALFGVREDLFEAGRSSEDNEVLEGTNFSVEAETPDGFRFRHTHNFMSGVMLQTEDGFNRWSQDLDLDRASAQALCDRVREAVESGVKLNPDCWVPTQGCYGSAGWDERAELDLEEREREMEGWFQ